MGILGLASFYNRNVSRLASGYFAEMAGYWLHLRMVDGQELPGRFKWE